MLNSVYLIFDRRWRRYCVILTEDDCEHKGFENGKSIVELYARYIM